MSYTDEIAKVKALSDEYDDLIKAGRDKEAEDVYDAISKIGNITVSFADNNEIAKEFLHRLIMDGGSSINRGIMDEISEEMIPYVMCTK